MIALGITFGVLLSFMVYKDYSFYICRLIVFIFVAWQQMDVGSYV